MIGNRNWGGGCWGRWEGGHGGVSGERLVRIYQPSVRKEEQIWGICVQLGDRISNMI